MTNNVNYSHTGELPVFNYRTAEMDIPELWQLLLLWCSNQEKIGLQNLPVEHCPTAEDRQNSAALSRSVTFCEYS